jgi:hypothetical protein
MINTIIGTALVYIIGDPQAQLIADNMEEAN